LNYIELNALPVSNKLSNWTDKEEESEGDVRKKGEGER
jgi:hypothetical protein